MNIMQFLAACAQIAFGAAAIWIACLQWKLSKNKSKFEVYEKRYDAYKGLSNFLGSVVKNGAVETQELVSFHWKFEEHYYLFGQDVHDYVKLIFEKSLEFKGYGNQLQGINSLPQGEERNAVVNKQDEILGWLLNQVEEKKKRFEKYLRIE